MAHKRAHDSLAPSFITSREWISLRGLNFLLVSPLPPLSYLLLCYLPRRVLSQGAAGLLFGFRVPDITSGAECWLRVSYAEWVAVASSESSGGYTVYVDPDTIRHEADGVEMWELYDYKKRGTTGGISFLSFKKLNEYNCGEERIRTLAVMYHSGNIGNGMVVSTNSEKGKWKRAPAGSVGEALWKFACGNK